MFLYQFQSFVSWHSFEGKSSPGGWGGVGGSMGYNVFTEYLLDMIWLNTRQDKTLVLKFGMDCKWQSSERCLLNMRSEVLTIVKLILRQELL